jgi:integrase/recombinase XerD
MQELLEDFKGHLQKKDFSGETIRAYLGDLRKFMGWYRGTEGALPQAHAVGPLDIAEFKRYLLSKNQKPSTINRALIALSSFFNWLQIDNPAAGVKSVPEVKTAPKSLGRKEMLSLVRTVGASENPRDLAIVTLLLHTGIRVSELCGLVPEDIFIKKRSGYLVVRSGKGNKRRKVPLNSTVRSALQKWLQTRGNKSGALFTGKRSDSLSPRAVEYLLQKYSLKAGLEKVTPHTLRHTFCKSLIDAGESIDRVAVLAGHENLNTTSKYTRATEKDLQKSVERLSWE